LTGRYLYSPNITISGGYSNSFSVFTDAGGTEMVNAANVRGIYHWWPRHNLHAGYGIQIINRREGGNDVVHDFDFGDDYFDTYQFELLLAPTLTLSGSTGLSIGTGTGGVRVANNSNLLLVKLWQLASFTAGARRGLTSSFGISGPSLTTTVFSNFNIRLTERLTGSASVNFSLFDTDDGNFKTFDASAGLQYWITTWLSSSLRYSHNFFDSGAGLSNENRADLTTRSGHTNSVVLTFSTHFNLWPNPGLANAIRSAPIYPSVIRQSPVLPQQLPPVLPQQPPATPTPSP
jgi:hypothetical protein